MTNFIRNFLDKYSSMSNNTKVVAKNTLYAFTIKGFALAISFFSVSLFIKYFNNNEVLGVWYTSLSVLTWFLTFDLGIGNGIRNHLVKALSENNRLKMKEIISSGLVATLAVTMLLTIVGFIILSSFNLNGLLNVSTDVIDARSLQKCVYLVFIALMMRFMLTIVSSIFYSLQRAAVNNFLALCVSILQLVYILIFRFDDAAKSLVNISLAYLFISNIPIAIAGIYIFLTELKDCRPSLQQVTKGTIEKIMSIGAIFFSCQIFYLIIVQTNEFFISHFWSPQNTAEYSFYYRMSMLLSMIISLGLTPLWSMITKAYSEKNYQWVSQLYRVIKMLGIALLIIQFAFVPFLQTAMNLWLGEGVLQVQLVTSLAFASFGATYIYSSMLSTLACGLAKMKLQFWCYGVGSILKCVLIVSFLKNLENWTVVIWINVLILLIYSILEHININRTLSSLKVNQ
jgi:O-antigen/teichoic acid export membrane protein